MQLIKLQSLLPLLVVSLVSSQNLPADVLAKGFVVPALIDNSQYTNVSSTVDCFQEANYASGMLNIYFAEQFHPEVTPFLEQLQKKNMGIQFIATPRLQDGAHLVEVLKKFLAPYNVTLDFLWIDISLLCEPVQIDENIQFLTDVAKNVRIGIRTSYGSWVNCASDWNASTLYNPPVWWEEENQVITSFNDFPPIGGWRSASIVTAYKVQECITVNNTVKKGKDFIYRIQDIENELSTEKPPTPVESTDAPNLYGKGFGLTVYQANTSFYKNAECLSATYDTCFLSVFRTTQLDILSIQTILALQAASIDIQPVITPDFGQTNAEIVLNKVLAVMADNDVVTKLLWVNTVYIYDGQNTMNFLYEMYDLLTFRGIKMGVLATSLPWIEFTNDWKYLAQNGVILWDQGELTTFDDFITFGGWAKADAHAFDNFGMSCNGDIIQADMKITTYNKTLINPSVPKPSKTTTTTTVTPIPPGQGQGILVSSDDQISKDDPRTELDCLRLNGYRAVFLNIFDFFELNMNTMSKVPLFYAEGFDVFLIMTPSVLTPNDANNAMLSIVNYLSTYGFKTNFVFYATDHFHESVDMNIATLNNVNSAAQAVNVSLGIMTFPWIWYANYNSTTAYSNVPLFNRDLQQLNYFQPFGGWKNATAASFNIASDCVSVATTRPFQHIIYRENTMAPYPVQSIYNNFTTYSLPFTPTSTPSNVTAQFNSSMATKINSSPNPTQDPSIGAGLYVVSDGPAVPLDYNCIKRNGYDSVFLQIYSDMTFNDYLSKQIKTIKAVGLAPQYVMKPDLLTQRFSPEYEITSVLQSFMKMAIYPEFLWIDATDLGPNDTANINYLQRLRQQASVDTIRTGIMAYRSAWVENMNNFTGPADDGSILWDSTVVAGFTPFSAYGGWTKPSVIAVENTNKCPPEEARLHVTDLLYTKADLDFTDHTSPSSDSSSTQTAVTDSSTSPSTTNKSPSSTTQAFESTTKTSSYLMLSHVFLIGLLSYFL